MNTINKVKYVRLKKLWYLVFVLYVFPLLSMAVAQNNSPSRSAGKILIQTSNKQDAEGYVCLELNSMNISTTWNDENKAIALFKMAKEIFSREDSIVKIRYELAAPKIHKLGLQEIVQNGIQVNPTLEFAISSGTYGDGDIVNLTTGRQFKYKALLNAMGEGNMYVSRFSWSADGRKLAIAGFHLNEKPYYLIEIDLHAQKVVSFRKYEKAIKEICYGTDSYILAVIQETSRMPMEWFWNFFGGHGKNYYDYYLTTYDSKTKSVLTPETLLMKDATHGARVLWVN